MLWAKTEGPVRCKSRTYFAKTQSDQSCKGSHWHQRDEHKWAKSGSQKHSEITAHQSMSGLAGSRRIVDLMSAPDAGAGGAGGGCERDQVFQWQRSGLFRRMS